MFGCNKQHKLPPPRGDSICACCTHLAYKDIEICRKSCCHYPAFGRSNYPCSYVAYLPAVRQKEHRLKRHQRFVARLLRYAMCEVILADMFGLSDSHQKRILEKAYRKCHRIIDDYLV